MAKADWHHLYNTARWKEIRANHLCQSPLCVMCEAQGRITQATVVDHKTPHKGNTELFYLEDNLQSLCKPCHDITKSRQEHRGYLQGHTVDGLPMDKSHHWFKSHGSC